MKKIAMAYFQKLAFIEELHADNWDGRNIGKAWAKVSNEVKYSYLTIPHFISYRGTIVSLGSYADLAALPSSRYCR